MVREQLLFIPVVLMILTTKRDHQMRPEQGPATQLTGATKNPRSEWKLLLVFHGLRWVCSMHPIADRIHVPSASHCVLTHMTACFQCKHPLLASLQQFLRWLYMCLSMHKLHTLSLFAAGAATGSQKGSSPDGRTCSPAAKWTAS